jgi:hypothetical protein
MEPFHVGVYLEVYHSLCPGSLRVHPSDLHTEYNARVDAVIETRRRYADPQALAIREGMVYVGPADVSREQFDRMQTALLTLVEAGFDHALYPEAWAGLEECWLFPPTHTAVDEFTERLLASRLMEITECAEARGWDAEHMRFHMSVMCGMLHMMRRMMDVEFCRAGKFYPTWDDARLDAEGEWTVALFGEHSVPVRGSSDTALWPDFRRVLTNAAAWEHVHAVAAWLPRVCGIPADERLWDRWATWNAECGVYDMDPSPDASGWQTEDES